MVLPLPATCRYRRAERRTGCQFKKDIEKRMVIFTGLTPIAERPTGAGLTLGMGLRAIAA